MAVALQAPEQAPRWIGEAGDDAQLARWYGGAAFHRGAAYASAGAVRSLRVESDGKVLRAQVAGSGERRYTTLVLAPSAGQSRPQGMCTCPVSLNCKHVVASLLAARRALRTAAGNGDGRAAAEPSRWEALLAPLAAGPPPTAPASPAWALQLELTGGPPLGPRVKLRPLTRGRSGTWIKTGASWRDLQYSHRRDGDAARDALVRVARLARAEQSYYVYGDTPVYLDELGPLGLTLLVEGVRGGLTLVGAAGAAVSLHAAPAAVALDVRQSTGGAVALRAALRDPDGAELPAPAALVGDPAFAYVGAGPDGLQLRPLAEPLDAATRRLLDAGSLAVPAPDVPRLLTRFYPALRRRVAVESSDRSVELPELAPPVLVADVMFGAAHHSTLRFSFAYRAGEVEALLPVSEPGADPARDPAAEQAIIDRLDVLDACSGVRLPTPAGYRLAESVQLQGLATATLVERVLPALAADPGVDVRVHGEPATYTEAAEAPLIAVSARDGANPDWFDLDVTVTVDGQPVAFAPLFTALALGEPRLLLDSGTWFRLDRPELHRLRELIDEARTLTDRPAEGLRLTPVQAGLWEELVSLGVVGEQSARWTRAVSGLLSLTEVPRPAPPAALHADLRSYQLDGYHWLSLLWDLQLGGVLADDMGLGKTVQTLAMAARAAANGTLGGEHGPLLVVAPTSVVGTWAEQARRFCPDLRVAVITETERKAGYPLADAVAGADLVVTSYTLLRIDDAAYRAVRFSGLVLDEAQFVKNHQAKTYQCARRLPVPFKLAITGTPLENSLMDLWSMLSITAPGLFPNPQRFAEFYRRPIESGTDPERLDTLRRRVRPLMLRRTKEQVAAELPPKTEQVLEVTLNPAHRRIYDTHLNRERQRVLKLVDDLDRNRIAILRSLTVLRQLSLDAALVDAQHAATVRSSKIDALVEQLTEVIAEGHRALVFSQFTRFLGRVKERLAAEGIDYCYLDGRTRNRAARIAEFTDGDAPVFLISLKAGGFGLTLTAADYVFVLDPWWNPATEQQAIDRTHRIGQDKPVMVYRLVAADTIEQKVVALQQRKRDLFARVVDEGAAGTAALSAADIRGLFGV